MSARSWLTAGSEPNLAVLSFTSLTRALSSAVIFLRLAGVSSNCTYWLPAFQATYLSEGCLPAPWDIVFLFHSVSICASTAGADHFTSPLYVPVMFMKLINALSSSFCFR